MNTEKSHRHVISFRVSTEEKNVLLEQARKHGLNMTQLMRKSLNALRRDS